MKGSYSGMIKVLLNGPYYLSFGFNEYVRRIQKIRRQVKLCKFKNEQINEPFVRTIHREYMNNRENCYSLFVVRFFFYIYLLLYGLFENNVTTRKSRSQLGKNK